MFIMNLFKQLVLSAKPLTYKLLEEVSDYDIYCELTGIDFEIGRAIQSPIRDDDTRSSFSLFIPTKYDVRPEEIWWRDFARGSGDVFKFVKLYAGLHYGEELVTRRDVIKFLDQELNLGLFDNTTKSDRQKRFVDYDKARERKEILFKSRPFTRMDKFWWIKFGIDQDLLEEHNVKSLKFLLNESYTVKYEFGGYELGFAYIVYDKVKIYCPTQTEFKWRNTCPSDYMLGAEQCTRKDILIITKSLKDIMVFKSFMNCDAISPQAEGLHMSNEIVEKIKTRYRDVFVVMDYDDAGIEAAEKLEDYGFKIRWVSEDKVLINGKLKVRDKDISDYVQNNGIIAGFKHLKKMFHELPDSVFKEERVKLLLEMKQELSN